MRLISASQECKQKTGIPNIWSVSPFKETRKGPLSVTPSYTNCHGDALGSAKNYCAVAPESDGVMMYGNVYPRAPSAIQVSGSNHHCQKKLLHEE